MVKPYLFPKDIYLLRMIFGDTLPIHARLNKPLKGGIWMSRVHIFESKCAKLITILHQLLTSSILEIFLVQQVAYIPLSNLSFLKNHHIIHCETVNLVLFKEILPIIICFFNNGVLNRTKPVLEVHQLFGSDIQIYPTFHPQIGWFFRQLEVKPRYAWNMP